MSVRRELLESFGVLGRGLLASWRDNGVTKESIDLREILGGFGCGGEARSRSRSGREDVGSAHAFGPCNWSTKMEDLKRDAKAEGGLAGMPEENCVGTSAMARGLAVMELAGQGSGWWCSSRGPR
jgi:hypothetical protein